MYGFVGVGAYIFFGDNHIWLCVEFYFWIYM